MTVLQKNGIAVDKDCSIILTDRENGTIRVVVTEGVLVAISPEQARHLAKLLLDAAMRGDISTLGRNQELAPIEEPAP